LVVDKSSAWYFLSSKCEFISFKMEGGWDEEPLIFLGALGYLGSQSEDKNIYFD